MKTLFTSLIALGVLAFGSAASAVTISPGSINGETCNTEIDIVTNTPIINCWTGAGTTDSSAFNVEDVAYETGFGLTNTDGTTILDTLYKVDYDDGAEEGTYDYSYDITWAGELNGGTIISTGTDAADIINCATCFLYVKDGTNDPIWYIFNISTWNGSDDLLLSGFWDDTNGSISHVAVFGFEGDKGLEPPAVPIPAAVWLFGSGLLGLVAVGRRKV